MSQSVRTKSIDDGPASEATAEALKCEPVFAGQYYNQDKDTVKNVPGSKDVNHIKKQDSEIHQSQQLSAKC